MGFILKNKWIIVGVFLGAILGYAYYYYVGCLSGACVISSKPLVSTIYFAVMGGLFFSYISYPRFKSKK
jgi:hypothetical protein